MVRERSRSVGGRFVAGGGEDHVPQNPLEAWMNEFDIVVNSGADSSAAVAATKETGLGVRAGYVGDKEVGFRRWTVYGGIWRPRGLADIPQGGTQDAGMKLQLQIGDQTGAPAILDRDDPLVVAEGILSTGMTTSGARIISWPKALDIIHPFPMYAEDLTLALDCTINNAFFTTRDWLLTLFYAVAEGRMEDQLQYLTTLQS